MILETEGGWVGGVTATGEKLFSGFLNSTNGDFLLIEGFELLKTISHTTAPREEIKAADNINRIISPT